MTHDALFRVTSALRDRLQAALVPDFREQASVFVGPLDDPDIDGAQLILFLYRIMPNASLRNRERRVPSANTPQVDLYRSSLPLDLYYLLTVAPTEKSGEAQKLQSLGRAIQSLQERPELSGPELNDETVRITFEPLTTEEASRIWTLFPAANYRTSVAYVASPVWIDPSAPTVLAPPVSEDSLNAGAKPQEVLR